MDLFFLQGRQKFPKQAMPGKAAVFGGCAGASGQGGPPCRVGRVGDGNIHILKLFFSSAKFEGQRYL